jgi:hypothetical protein
VCKYPAAARCSSQRGGTCSAATLAWPVYAAATADMCRWSRRVLVGCMHAQATASRCRQQCRGRAAHHACEGVAVFRLALLIARELRATASARGWVRQTCTQHCSHPRFCSCHGQQAGEAPASGGGSLAAAHQRGLQMEAQARVAAGQACTPGTAKSTWAGQRHRWKQGEARTGTCHLQDHMHKANQ